MLAEISSSEHLTDPEFQDSIRLTASYIVKGFFIASMRPKLEDIPDWDGEVGLVDRLGKLAHLVEREYQRLYDAHPDGCGCVWEYEVSEILGTQLAHHVSDNGNFPEMDEIKKWVRSMAAEAFNVPVPEPIVNKFLQLTGTAKELGICITLRVTKATYDQLVSESNPHLIYDPGYGRHASFNGMKIKVVE